MIEDANTITMDDFKNRLPGSISPLLDRRDSLPLLLKNLTNTWTPDEVSPKAGDKKTEEQRLWELIGLYILKKRGAFEAIAIFKSLYDHMLKAQDEKGYRVHKGMPLLWISECFLKIGYLTHAKRYLMLTLCEDAITSKSSIDPDNTGVYFRLVWRHGLPDSDIKRYANEIFSIYKTDPINSLFPEWVLQELDQDWMTEYPNINESSKYFITEMYLRHLISQLGEPSGKILERIGAYLLSCTPGFRATTRRVSRSTEYDIVCSVEGSEIDFRSEIGRYFVCECKDLTDPAGFSILAKFCRVLDSTKCSFGILFSTKGISGEGRGTFAEREQIKIFQDRGLVIIVVNKDDLKYISSGGNFVSVLRDKYEKVRMDLV